MQHNNSKKAKIIIQTLAKVIKMHREKLNKSQRLFSYEYDIQRSLLSRLENGINEPKIISLWTICEALNIPLSQLIKEVEQKLPDKINLIEK